MKKKLLLILLTIGLLLTFASCNQSITQSDSTGESDAETIDVDRSTAESTLNAYVQALLEGDLETMYLLEGYDESDGDSFYEEWKNTLNAAFSMAISNTSATIDITRLEINDSFDKYATGYVSSSIDIFSIDSDLQNEGDYTFSGEDYYKYSDDFAILAEDEKYLSSIDLCIELEEIEEKWQVNSIY
jgi:hypothetical protein